MPCVSQHGGPPQGPAVKVEGISLYKDRTGSPQGFRKEGGNEEKGKVY